MLTIHSPHKQTRAAWATKRPKRAVTPIARKKSTSGGSWSSNAGKQRQKRKKRPSMLEGPAKARLPARTDHDSRKTAVVRPNAGQQLRPSTTRRVIDRMTSRRRMATRMTRVELVSRAVVGISDAVIGGRGRKRRVDRQTIRRVSDSGQRKWAKIGEERRMKG